MPGRLESGPSGPYPDTDAYTNAGFITFNSSYPNPYLSAAPGLKFCPNISAVLTNLCNIVLASGSFKFRVILLTPRLFVSKKELTSSPLITPALRLLSPPLGTSIFITSAPKSAINMYGTVPATAVEQVITLIPSNAPFKASMRISL